MDMDVQGVGAPAGMNPAAPAQQMDQAQEQQAEVQAAKTDAPRQDVQGGTAPGVGGNLNITV